jgi:hypothetical protein
MAHNVVQCPPYWCQVFMSAALPRNLAWLTQAASWLVEKRGDTAFDQGCRGFREWDWFWGVLSHMLDWVNKRAFFSACLDYDRVFFKGESSRHLISDGVSFGDDLIKIYKVLIKLVYIWVFVFKVFDELIFRLNCKIKDRLILHLNSTFSKWKMLLMLFIFVWTLIFRDLTWCLCFQGLTGL